MARLTLSFDGLDEYMEKLKKAAVDVDFLAEEALSGGAAILLMGMRSRASFSRRIVAALRMTSVMKDGNKRYLYLGILRDTNMEVARMANTWEFGGVGSDSRSRTDAELSPEHKFRKQDRVHRPWIKAKPFIRPTLRRDIGKAKSEMAAVFQDWLKG